MEENYASAFKIKIFQRAFQFCPKSFCHSNCKWVVNNIYLEKFISKSCLASLKSKNLRLSKISCSSYILMVILMVQLYKYFGQEILNIFMDPWRATQEKSFQSRNLSIFCYFSKKYAIFAIYFPLSYNQEDIAHFTMCVWVIFQIGHSERKDWYCI